MWCLLVGWPCVPERDGAWRGASGRVKLGGATKARQRSGGAAARRWHVNVRDARAPGPPAATTNRPVVACHAAGLPAVTRPAHPVPSIVRSRSPRPPPPRAAPIATPPHTATASSAPPAGAPRPRSGAAPTYVPLPPYVHPRVRTPSWQRLQRTGPAAHDTSCVRT